jgi:hypothetical protein
MARLERDLRAAETLRELGGALSGTLRRAMHAEAVTVLLVNTDRTALIAVGDCGTTPVARATC